MATDDQGPRASLKVVTRVVVNNNIGSAKPQRAEVELVISRAHLVATTRSMSILVQMKSFASSFVALARAKDEKTRCGGDIAGMARVAVMHALRLPDESGQGTKAQVACTARSLRTPAFWRLTPKIFR
jgi:hypothetical protein